MRCSGSWFLNSKAQSTITGNLVAALLLGSLLPYPVADPLSYQVHFSLLCSSLGPAQGDQCHHDLASVSGMPPLAPDYRICPQEGEDVVFSPARVEACGSPHMCLVAFDLFQACVQCLDLPGMLMTMIKAEQTLAEGFLGPSHCCKCLMSIFSFFSIWGTFLLPWLHGYLIFLIQFLKRNTDQRHSP